MKRYGDTMVSYKIIILYISYQLSVDQRRVNYISTLNGIIMTRGLAPNHSVLGRSIRTIPLQGRYSNSTIKTISLSISLPTTSLSLDTPSMIHSLPIYFIKYRRTFVIKCSKNGTKPSSKWIQVKAPSIRS